MDAADGDLPGEPSQHRVAPSSRVPDPRRAQPHREAGRGLARHGAPREASPAGLTASRRSGRGARGCGRPAACIGYSGAQPSPGEVATAVSLVGRSQLVERRRQGGHALEVVTRQCFGATNQSPPGRGCRRLRCALCPTAPPGQARWRAEASAKAAAYHGLKRAVAHAAQRGWPTSSMRFGLSEAIEPRRLCDPTGHYHRPDVFPRDSEGCAANPTGGVGLWS